MAKGQKKTNKEARKPKAEKGPVVSQTGALFAKGALTPLGAGKKK